MTTGSVGVWQLARRRSQADGPLVLAAWLLLLASITLLSAASGYASVVALDAIHQAVASSPAGSRGVAVRVSAGPSDVDAFDSSVRTLLAGVQEATDGDVARVVREN